MKTYLRVFFWGLLLGGSFHSNSKDFKWKLDCNGETILRGVITPGHEGNFLGYSTYTCCDYLSSEDYTVFESIFTYAITFTQNQSGLSLPLPLSILLNDGSSNFNHRFNLSYTFRARTISTARNLGAMSCILCCFPCTFVQYMLTDRLCCEPASYDRRWGELQAARPDNVPANVQVQARSLSHQCLTGSGITIGSSTYSDIGATTTVFDLFMTAPLAQQWLNGILNHQVQLNQMIMIPGLLNSEQMTQVVTQNIGNGYHDSMVATHFLTFTTGGVSVQYHLNQSPGNQIDVLAIVITYENYTMVINVEGYSTSEHEQPPLYSEINTCSCTLVCTCKNSRRNDSDDTGAGGGSNGWSVKPYLLPGTSSF